MGKHDFLAPKAIANRQKSIGLQRLRWYCQMCEKQCRDENGFKCHTTSEGHLRQMRVFSENSGRILSEFSREFEKGFLEILSHRHGTKRVSANKVYQEYIGDKNHVHMNATCWTTLTGLCMYLGKEGKAIVDETEKGWFIQYVDRDPKALARLAEKEQRQKHDLDEQEQNNRIIEMQIAAARKLKEVNGDEEEVEKNILVREDSDSKVSVPLKLSGLAAPLSKKRVFQSFAQGSIDDEDEGEANTGRGTKIPSFLPPSSNSSIYNNSLKNNELSGIASDAKPTVPVTSVHEVSSRNGSGSASSSFNHNSTQSSSAQAVLKSQHDRKDVQNAQEKSHGVQQSELKDYWLSEGLLVKVVSKKLDQGRWYKSKGEVRRMIDKYSAEVRITSSLGSNDSSSTSMVVAQQEDLETVVPSRPGARVRIVNGRGRGLEAEVLELFPEKFRCDVLVVDRGADDSMYRKTLRDLDYEHICSFV